MTLTTQKTTAFQNLGNWIKGEVTTGNGTVYTFCAKVFDEGSEYGINEGRISKLEIRLGKEWLVNYDRGWDVRPKDAETKAVYKRLLNEYN